MLNTDINLERQVYLASQLAAKSHSLVGGQAL